MRNLKTNDKLSLATLFLRVGLAITFLYAGWSALRSPDEWVGYVPHFATHVLAAGTALKLMALYELVLGALLVAGQFLRYVGLLCALTVAGILATNLGQLIITFRDVGLLGAALALTLLAW